MQKGTLKTVIGDVTNPQFTLKNEQAVIVHVCNNKRAYAAGVALAIRKKWESAYNRYIASKMELGTNSYQVVDGRTTVVNMVAQTLYEGDEVPLKYEALIKCMTEVKEYILNSHKIEQELEMDRKFVIHAPKFGSELARGCWDFILELIREIWIENGVDVVIYEFIK